MRININEAINLLYICNVNSYEMYMDTEQDCITIEVNDSMERVDVDELVEGLEELFDDVEVVDNKIYCSYYFERER